MILGAHPDDIEFAMGATLARLIREGEHATIAIMSKSLHIEQNQHILDELTNSMDVLGVKDYEVHDFQTRSFEQQSTQIRNAIFKLKQEVQPSIVFCPSLNAMHPDHVTVGKSCKSIFQETSILAYEDIRGNHDVMINHWYALSETDVDTKIKALSCYQSQTNRTYFDMEQIRAVSMYRGLQVGVKYAEGFEALRVVV